MKASEFISHYRLHTDVAFVEDFTQHLGGDTVPRRRWTVTYTYRDADGEPRAEGFNYETGTAEEASTLDTAEALHVIADAARYGESYEALVDEFGPGVTLDQWRAGERATRERAEAWLARGPAAMWGDFLDITSDDSTD